MAICSAMLYDSLMDRSLEYSATCSVQVMFAVVRFVTAVQYSAVACYILENAMDISIAVFTVTVLYYSWREVCCRSRRSACALMKCA